MGGRSTGYVVSKHGEFLLLSLLASFFVSELPKGAAEAAQGAIARTSQLCKGWCYISVDNCQ